MNKKRTLSEQNIRLILAYRKIPQQGKNALERIVNQLTKIHKDFSKSQTSAAAKPM